MSDELKRYNLTVQYQDKYDLLKTSDDLIQSKLETDIHNSLCHSQNINLSHINTTGLFIASFLSVS